MEEIIKKVSYLKGLVEGLEISEKSDEGKVILKMVDILEDMADALDEVYAEQDDILEYVEEIDEDLTDLEDDLYEDEEDDYDFDDDDMEYYEIECPNCHETVCIDEDYLALEDDIKCPNCGEDIDFEFGCDDCDEESCEGCDKF